MAADWSFPDPGFPQWLTSFVDREEDQRALVDLLENPRIRLITILGLSGIGKTRLAVKTGAELSTPSVFIRLHECRTVSEALAIIARKLGLHSRGDGGEVDQIAASIGRRALVLVLDGVESIAGFGESVASLLSRCPLLKVMVTSRRTLRQSGEYVYSLAPLSTVAAGDHGAPQTRSAAAELFNDRVIGMGLTSFDPGDPREHRAVESICALLDGLPLAIELAAARTQLMPPSVLLERFHGSPPGGSTGGPGSSDYLVTIRSSILSAYQMLSIDEQWLLMNLCVCRGGFTAKQASQMMAGASRDEAAASVDDLLTSLIEQSLVHHAAMESRLYVLRAIREFGIERLVEMDALEDAQRRHMLVFSTSQLAANLDLMDGYAGTGALQDGSDVENLRAALSTALVMKSAEHAWPLAAALGGYWWDSGQFAEAFATYEDLVEIGNQLEPLVRMRVIGWGAEWAWLTGRTETTYRYAEQALHLARTENEQSAEAVNLYRMARVVTRQHPARAVELLTEALLRFERAESRRPIVWTNLGLGYAHLLLNNQEDARVAFDRASELSDFVPTHHLGGLNAAALQGQAWYFYKTGNLEKSERICRSADRESRLHRNPFGQFGALRLLARIALDRDDLLEAHMRYAEALSVAVRLGMLDRATQCLVGLAAVAAARGDLERSMLLIGVQDIVQQSAHQTLEIEDIRIREKTVAQGKAMLGQERFARYITMGRQEAWDLVASVIDGSFAAVQATTLRFPLTRREHDVLALLAPGHTNREIADRLFLSPRTVDSHVASIMSKLGVHTRHAALARARELELIA